MTQKFYRLFQLKWACRLFSQTSSKHTTDASNSPIFLPYTSLLRNKRLLTLLINILLFQHHLVPTSMSMKGHCENLICSLRKLNCSVIPELSVVFEKIRPAWKWSNIINPLADYLFWKSLILIHTNYLSTTTKTNQSKTGKNKRRNLLSPQHL